MTRILFADNDYPDVELERALFARAGVELVVGAVQDRGRRDRGGARLPRHPAAVRADHRDASSRRCRTLGIVSRIGAGFDTVDTDACASAGVWVANSPDYGVGEVATHALALALASMRNIVAYNRDIARRQVALPVVRARCAGPPS